MDEFLREARALLPWLPESLIQIYADSFSEIQSFEELFLTLISLISG